MKILLRDILCMFVGGTIWEKGNAIFIFLFLFFWYSCYIYFWSGEGMKLKLMFGFPYKVQPKA